MKKILKIIQFQGVSEANQVYRIENKVERRDANASAQK